jgi:hypothetical protein
MSRSRSRALPALLIGAGFVVAVIVAQSLSLLPNFSNPVTENEVDRSAPPLLLSLDDLDDLHASTGNMQVIVDRELDVRYVPGFLAGERVVYQAVGSIDGVVSLSEVESRITVDEATGERVVTFTLPPAELSEVHLDLDESKVVDSSSGLCNRVGDFFKDNPGELQELQRMGSAKIATAGRESGVLERAEENARKLLTDLALRAGADDVVVEFVEPAEDDDPTTERPAA